MNKRAYRKTKWKVLLLGFLCAIFCVGKQAEAEEVLSVDGKVNVANGIVLSWKSNSEDNVYRIEKSKDSDKNYKVFATISGQAGTIVCHDYNVKLGFTYYYRISRIQDDRVKEQSRPLKIKIALQSPKKLKAKKLSEEQVKLSWESVYGAKRYEIYRSTKKTGKYKKIGSSKRNSYVDKTVKRGKAYYYRVVAVGKNKGADSPVSNTAAAYIRPQSVQVMGTYTNEQVHLAWRKVSGADMYYIYKMNAKGVFKKVKQTKKLYYKDKNVKFGNTYYYKVEAVYKKDGKIIKSSPNTVCEVRAWGIDPNKKMVALTFDDGPGRYTEDIVQCLQKYNSRATFFVLGCNVDSYPNALRAADQIGCEIGNHSYNHSSLTKLSDQAIWSQMADTDAKVQAVIGKTPALMRPPGGGYNDRVRNTVGKPVILWSIDTLDWKTRDRDKTVQAVLSNVQDGDIVLMHDIHEPTKDAALILIPELNRRGYQLVTVSELAYYKGYSLYNGGVYHSIR